MKIKNVKIGKRLQPVYFGNAALAEFEDMTGTSLLNGFSSPTYAQSLKLAYVGCKQGSRKEGAPFQFDFEAFCDLLDEDSTGKALTAILDIFAASMPQNQEQEAEPGKASGA